jgi:hypothetical protein
MEPWRVYTSTLNSVQFPSIIQILKCGMAKKRMSSAMLKQSICFSCANINYVVKIYYLLRFVVSILKSLLLLFMIVLLIAVLLVTFIYFFTSQMQYLQFLFPLHFRNIFEKKPSIESQIFFARFLHTEIKSTTGLAAWLINI